MGGSMTEWRTRRVDEVATVFDGPHETPAKTAAGPWFLSVSSLVGGRLDLSESAHLAERDFAEWTRRVTPEAGDVLFSYETRLGEAALMPGGVRACLGRRMGLLRPDRTVVDPRFLLYAYLAPDFRRTIERHTVRGATVDRIPLLDLPGWPIRVPRDLGVQREIAGLLGALDDKIAINAEIIGSYDDLIRATFVRLGWDAEPDRDAPPVVLGDLLAFNPRCPRPDRDPPYASMASVPTRGSRVVSWPRRPIAPGARFRNGDTLLARITPCLENGKVAFVDGLAEGVTGTGSTELIVLRPKPGVAVYYTYGLARSPRFRAYAIASLAGGSGRQRCPVGALARFPVRRPDEAATRRFDSDVRAAFAHTASLGAESDDLARLRDALLPGLMDGTIRLRAAEHLVP
jgi:type I restriction enzyme S subunit